MDWEQQRSPEEHDSMQKLMREADSLRLTDSVEATIDRNLDEELPRSKNVN